MCEYTNMQVFFSLRIASVIIKPGTATDADMERMDYRHGHPKKIQSPSLSYSCSQCGHSCRTKSSLQKHMKSHKTVDPGYACLTCDRQFSRKSSLVSHAKTHRHKSMSVPPTKAQLPQENGLRKLMEVQRVQQQRQHEEVKQLYKSMLAAAPRREPGVLDEGAAKIALQLQQPLFDILGNTHVSHRPTHLQNAPVASKSEAELEYDTIIKTYGKGTVLQGLKWTDFIRASPTDLHEIIGACSGLAHRLAFKRLHADH